MPTTQVVADAYSDDMSSRKHANVAIHVPVSAARPALIFAEPPTSPGSDGGPVLTTTLASPNSLAAKDSPGTQFQPGGHSKGFWESFLLLDTGASPRGGSHEERR